MNTYIVKVSTVRGGVIAELSRREMGGGGGERGVFTALHMTLDSMSMRVVTKILIYACS
jgi:hypothetical protein